MGKGRGGNRSEIRYVHTGDNIQWYTIELNNAIHNAGHKAITRDPTSTLNIHFLKHETSRHKARLDMKLT